MVSPLQPCTTFWGFLNNDHALSLGNYHTVIVCPESQRDKGEEILNWVQKRAIELDGTVTGEHGIGSKLRERLVDEVGPESVHMMRRVSSHYVDLSNS